MRMIAALALSTLMLAFPALAPAKAATPEIRIVAIGDSAINGHGVSRSEAYPAQLEAALNARGHHVVVSNQGVDGDTTDGVLQRLDRDVPEGTDIVVLQIGSPRGNDVVLHHLTPEYAEANAQEIMRRLRARGIDVYRVVRMQEGIIDRPDLHVESFHNPANTMWHLNAAGYAIVVQRTLPAIEALVKKAEKRKH